MIYPDTVTITGKVYVPKATPAPQVRYWRQPHDKELTSPGPAAATPSRNYRGNATGTVRGMTLPVIPEPFRLPPDHQVPLNCDFQKLIRDCNPEHRDDVVDNALDSHWILANNTGLGEAGRRNCRTGAYVNDPLAKWPALHTPIVCGGALLSGTVTTGFLEIESILTTNPAPPAEYVLSRPWLWFWLVETNPQGAITYMTLSARDGSRKPVRMPLITRLPVYAPLNWLDEMPAGFDPANYDPRQYG